jgi:hypothetical protein
MRGGQDGRRLRCAALITHGRHRLPGVRPPRRKDGNACGLDGTPQSSASLGSCGVAGNLNRSVPMLQPQRPTPLVLRIATDLPTFDPLDHRNLHLGPIVQHLNLRHDWIDSLSRVYS